MGIWTDLWRTKAANWAFGPIGSTTPVTPNKRYVSVTLRRLRIADSRVGFSRFYGAVQFYGRLSHLSGNPAEFASMTSAGKLSDVPKKDRANFTILNQRLLGPVPYIGGDLEIEIGLFTIKAQDLLMPYLELLADLSTAAGVAYFSVAAPFVAAIKKGAAALTRPEGSSALEIGLAATFDPVAAGTYFVARIDSDDYDTTKFNVDSNSSLLDDKGQHVAKPYLIFEVTQSDVRHDVYQIPAIGAAYEKLRLAVLEEKSLTQIRSYQEHFRRVVLTDPDVLKGHDEEIIRWADDEVKRVHGFTPTSGGAKGPTLPALRTLKLTPL
jgi:hypothetical protein